MMKKQKNKKRIKLKTVKRVKKEGKVRNKIEKRRKSDKYI